MSLLCDLKTHSCSQLHLSVSLKQAGKPTAKPYFDFNVNKQEMSDPRPNIDTRALLSFINKAVQLRCLCLTNQRRSALKTPPLKFLNLHEVPPLNLVPGSSAGKAALVSFYFL